MKITKISATNFKGRTFEQNLTGRDIFTGYNGAGKTSRIQAIGLAMMGYVPGNGKTNDETFKLASSNEMKVCLETENFSVERTFISKEKFLKGAGEPKVEISQDIQLVPSMGEKKVEEKKNRISNELGNIPAMLDYQEFVSLTDSKRREFFYTLSDVSSSSFDREYVEKSLQKELLSNELKENNVELYNAIEECIEESMKTFPKGYSIQEGLTSMIDFVTNKLSYWKKERVRSESAAQKLSEMKNSLEETDRNIGQNKEELENLRLKINERSSLFTQDTERAKSNKARADRIEELRTSLKEWQDKTCNIDINAYKKELELLESSKIKITSLDEALETIDNMAKEAQDNKSRIQEQISNSIVSRSELTVGIVESNKILDLIKNMEEGRKYCILDKNIACNKDFSKYVEHKKLSVKNVEEMIKNIEIDIKNSNAELEVVQLKINACKKEREDAYKFNNEQRQLLADQEETIAELKEKILKAENFDSTRKQMIESLKSSLQKAESVELYTLCDLDLVKVQIEGLESQYTELKRKIQEQEEAKITLINMQNSLMDEKKANNNEYAFKQIQALLGVKGIQGDIVKNTLEPIQKDVQLKLDNMDIPFEFSFYTESRSGKEIFQFGWQEPGFGFRNFDALSQGERVILLIALMTTIIERANPPLKILIIDNIQDLDDVNIRKVITGLDKIGASMDNIILAAANVPVVDSGFSYWRVDKRETVMYTEDSDMDMKEIHKTKS